MLKPGNFPFKKSRSCETCSCFWKINITHCQYEWKKEWYHPLPRTLFTDSPVSEKKKKWLLIIHFSCVICWKREASSNVYYRPFSTNSYSLPSPSTTTINSRPPDRTLDSQTPLSRLRRSILLLWLILIPYLRAQSWGQELFRTGSALSTQCRYLPLDCRNTSPLWLSTTAASVGRATRQRSATSAYSADTYAVGIVVWQKIVCYALGKWWGALAIISFFFLSYPSRRPIVIYLYAACCEDADDESILTCTWCSP